MFYTALAAFSSLTLLSTDPAFAQGRPDKPETPATPEKPETPVVSVENPEIPVKPETPVRPEKPADDGELEVEGSDVELEVEDPEAEKLSKDDIADKAKNGNRPDFVDELRSARDSYNQERKTLREALKAELTALGDEATKEQIEEVVTKFRETNAELIAAQKEAAEEIKLAAKEGVKANVPARILDLRQTLRTAKDERKAARDAFKTALANAEKAEDKKTLVEAFRTEQRDKHKQLKDELKKLREETRSNANDSDSRLDE
jgi:hypothetical protein